ncbi:hypothetical protein EON65_53485 [archaeon]|nr:MAG: hypothetical protein EON65_53485 [archaeon]
MAEVANLQCVRAMGRTSQPAALPIHTSHWSRTKDRAMEDVKELEEVKQDIREAKADLRSAKETDDRELELEINDRLNLLLKKEKLLITG